MFKSENELFESAEAASVAYVDQSKLLPSQSLILAVWCMSLVITGMDVAIDTQRNDPLLDLRFSTAFRFQAQGY